MKKSILAISIVASSLLLLTGCGGSSSSSNNDEGTQSSVVKGKAIDGYLRNATVILDMNNNGYFDVGEPITATLPDGSFNLDVSSVKNDANYSKAMLVIYDGIDNDTGNRFTGKIKAPNDGNLTQINVTPITTQVVALMDQNVSKTEAEQKVKTIFDIPANVSLNANPIALNKKGDPSLLKASLALQKSLDVMVAKIVNTTGMDKYKVTKKVLTLLAKTMKSMNTTNSSNDFSTVLDSIKNAPNASSDLDVNQTALNTIIAATTTVHKKVTKTIENAIQSDKNISNSMVPVSDYTSKVIDENDISTIDNLEINTSINAQEQKNINFLKSSGVNTTGIDTTKLAKINFDGKTTEEIIKTLKDNNLTNIADELQTKYNQDKSNMQMKKQMASSSTIAFQEDTPYYSIWNDGDDNGTTIYGYNAIKLNSENKTLTSTEYNSKSENNSTTWIKNSDDENQLLENGKLVNDSSEKYKKQQDGSILVGNRQKVIIKSEQDLSNKSVYIPALGKSITMPKGAKKEFIMLDYIKDEYMVDHKAKTHGNMGQDYGSKYYKTLPDFIQGQCATNWFSGDDDGGVAFAGTDNGDGTYTCDTSATSGKLFFVKQNDNGSEIINKNAGTWKITTVEGKKVLIVNSNYKEYSDDDSKTFFVDINDTVYRGDYTPKGSKEFGKNLVLYNQVAMNAIKQAIIDDTKTIISKPKAIKNVISADKVKTLLSNKTFYVVGSEDSSIKIFKFVVSSDGTQFKQYDLDSQSPTDSDSITYNGDKVAIGTGDGYTIFTQKNGYILGQDYGTFDSMVHRLYTSKADAQKYYNSLTSSNSSQDLKSLIVGKTYYVAVNDADPVHVETIQFKNDGKTMLDTWLKNGQEVTSTFTYSIANERLHIVGTGGDGDKIDTDIIKGPITQTDTYIKGSGGSMFYKTEQAAKDALK